MVKPILKTANVSDKCKTWWKMFKMQRDKPKFQKNVTTDKKYTLRKMDLKFQSLKFSNKI